MVGPLHYSWTEDNRNETVVDSSGAGELVSLDRAAVFSCADSHKQGVAGTVQSIEVDECLERALILKKKQTCSQMAGTTWNNMKRLAEGCPSPERRRKGQGANLSFDRTEVHCTVSHVNGKRQVLAEPAVRFSDPGTKHCRTSKGA